MQLTMLKTSEPRLHTVKMHASAVIALRLLMTLTLDRWSWKSLQQCLHDERYICGKLQWNASAKYRDIAWREIGANVRTMDRQRTAGRTTEIQDASSACS